MKTLLKIILVSATVLVVIYFLAKPNRIRTYEFYSKAKVIQPHPTYYRVVEGESYVISITKGRGASKTTTAHGHWHTIYLVLSDPPKVGESQIITEVYSGGYFRGSRWGVDPKQTEEISVTPIKLSDTESKFKITGTLQLREWRKVDDEEIEVDSELEVSGSENVQWRPNYKEFEFNSTYTCRPATLNVGE